MGVFEGHGCGRFLCLAAVSLIVILFMGVGAGDWSHAQAQEGDQATEGAAPTPEKKQSLIKHIIVSAGPIFGGLIACMSIGLVALIVLLALDLRMSTSVPPDFVEEFTDTINKRKFKEAFDLARNDTSFLGRVIAGGMARLQYGIEDAREAAINTVENIKASKEQLITYLATVGTLGPMIGLVGTVFGMIMAFMELGRPGVQPDPAKLAEGISHALVITLLGIALSVPAIFFHAFFRNRLIRITMDSSNIADDLLTQMYHNSRKPASASESRATAPAASAQGATPTAAIKPA